MPNLTLRQMAEHFGLADGAGQDEIDALHTRLRGLSQRGLFLPVAQRGKAAEYDPATVCATRLLLTAADLGLDQFALRPMREFMFAPIPVLDVTLTPGRVTRDPREIERAMDWTRDGGAVAFVTELRRYADERGLVARHSFVREDAPSDLPAGLAEGVKLVAAAQRGEYRLLATLTLPASDLMRPLLTEEA